MLKIKEILPRARIVQFGFCCSEWFENGNYWFD